MLTARLLEAACRDPDKPAVLDPQTRLSYRQLAAQSALMRKAVAEHTDCPRIAVMLPSSAAFASTFFGILWAGRTAVPINFLLQRAELTAVLRDAGVDLLVTCRAFEKQFGMLGVRTLYVDDVLAEQGSAASAHGDFPPPPACGEDDVAVILYTSGSSGAPKGVCLTHRNLLSNCNACIEHARMNPDQRFLGVLPLFHAFGLTAMLLAPVVLGATVQYLPRFQPALVAETIREQAISIFMAVPSMYAAMLRLHDVSPDCFAPLVLALSGGEPLPPNVAAACEQHWGVRLMEGYGLTETSPVVSINTPWAYRPRTVGQALPGVEVQIVDSAGGWLPADADGEVLIRGRSVMKAYYNRPDETAAAIDAQGWFHTGDVGRVDADGFLSITGRLKELIIVGGDNVFPGEVEAVLVQHPAVAEAAVIGSPDPARGEVVAAFVTVREGVKASDTEIRSFCRERLAGYKVPREVRVVPELPRGPTGKVLKRALKDWLK